MRRRRAKLLLQKSYSWDGAAFAYVDRLPGLSRPRMLTLIFLSYFAASVGYGLLITVLPATEEQWPPNLRDCTLQGLKKYHWKRPQAMALHGCRC